MLGGQHVATPAPRPSASPPSSLSGTARLSCSGCGGFCRALGAGGRVCSPGPPVLLASQRGHPFRASVSMACWDDHSVVVPAFWDGSGSSGRAQGARPAPVCRFHSHFLVQTGVNLSLEKGPVPEMVAAPLPCLILGTGSGAHNVSPRH